MSQVCIMSVTFGPNSPFGYNSETCVKEDCYSVASKRYNLDRKFQTSHIPGPLVNTLFKNVKD